MGLLTRNILFTSDATSAATAKGPHTTLMTPDARVSGAAYERWGTRNVAGRYSVHFHLVRWGCGVGGGEGCLCGGGAGGMF